MRTILYLAVILATLFIVQCGPPLIGDADARGPARTVTEWPWE
jgi:hypothetical protein